jgi:hypothetical protein
MPPVVALKLWVARVLMVTAVMASVLVPAFASPSRVISIPQTMAASMHFHGQHPAGFRSEIERFSFAPTHVAFVWTGSAATGIRYRSVMPGRGLSRWHIAAEATDLGHGNVHYSGVLEINGATGIQWRALVPRGDQIGPVTVDYMNTLDGPRVNEQIPAVANALAKTPDIVTRAEWGADESIKRATGGCTRQFFPVQQLFVHHTAGTNHDSHPRATMRAIYYFHTRIRGWCDIGYNFVIGPNGEIFEGRWARTYSPWETHTSETRRGQAVMGAHVLHFNAGSVGISLMGNYSLIPLPAAMRSSLDRLLAWEADRHNLRPLVRHTYRSPTSSTKRWLPYIAGHRDAGATACPGNYVYAALPTIRKETTSIIGGGKVNTFLSLDASADAVAAGRSVTFSGRLTGASKRPLRGFTVHLYIKRAGQAWRDNLVTTNAEGAFSLRLFPRSSLRAGAAFFGGPLRWGSESLLHTVIVKA